MEINKEQTEEIIQSLEKITDFTVDKLNPVAEEIVSYLMISSLIYFVLSIGFVLVQVFGVYWLFNYKQKSEDRLDGDELLLVTLICGAFSVILPLRFAFDHLNTFIKTIVAPKMVVIEYVANLLSGS